MNSEMMANIPQNHQPKAHKIIPIVILGAINMPIIMPNTAHAVIIIFLLFVQATTHKCRILIVR